MYTISFDGEQKNTARPKNILAAEEAAIDFVSGMIDQTNPVGTKVVVIKNDRKVVYYVFVLAGHIGVIKSFASSNQLFAQKKMRKWMDATRIQ